MCVDVSNYGKGPRLDVYQCSHSTNQMWSRKINPACSEAEVASQGVPCSQIVSGDGRCLTKVVASGAEIGLDAGTMYTIAQALPCEPIGEPSQLFDVVRGDQGGFPDSFPMRAPADESSPELCMQPYIAKEPDFDAIAFETPDGSVSVVAMNKGEEALTFSLYDEALGLGATEVVSPPHSIQSFKLPSVHAIETSVSWWPFATSATTSLLAAPEATSATGAASGSSAAAAGPSGIGTPTAGASLLAGRAAIGLVSVGIVAGLRRAVGAIDAVELAKEGRETARVPLATTDEDEQPYVEYAGAR